MSGRKRDEEESFLDWDGKPTLFEDDLEEVEEDEDEDDPFEDEELEEV